MTGWQQDWADPERLTLDDCLRALAWHGAAMLALEARLRRLHARRPLTTVLLTARNALIMAALANGETPEVIAARFGISVHRIAQIRRMA